MQNNLRTFKDSIYQTDLCILLMGRGEFCSVHVGHLVYSFAEDNMYEFEIDCLIFTITCDILILTERGIGMH